MLQERTAQPLGRAAGEVQPFHLGAEGAQGPKLRLWALVAQLVQPGVGAPPLPPWLEGRPEQRQNGHQGAQRQSVWPRTQASHMALPGTALTASRRLRLSLAPSIPLLLGITSMADTSIECCGS